MIVGTPNSFCIMADVVGEWNYDNSFNNGVLFVNINEKIFPNKVIEATLNTELCELIRNFENVKENSNIFAMEKNKAFECIYKLTFPDCYDVDNDYSYNVTPFVLWDNNYFIFMVSNGKKIRVLASELQYIIDESVHNLQKLKVEEVYISAEKLQDMIKKLKSFRLEIQKNLV